jgi:hypothetical protein
MHDLDRRIEELSGLRAEIVGYRERIAGRARTLRGDAGE